MAKRLRLLHLTDLHFTSFPIPAEDVDAKIELPDLDAAIRAKDRSEQFLRDLRRVFRAPKEWPQAIVVSGDLVDKGGTDRAADGRGEFDQAIEFLEQVAGQFELADDRVLVVPGNHDIDWSPDLPRMARFRSYFDATRKFSSPYDRAGQLTPKFVTVSSPDGEITAEIALLASPTFSGEPDPVVEQLNRHISELTEHLSSEATKRTELMRQVRSTVLDIAAIGVHQLKYVEENRPVDKDSIRIAVLHHHLLPILQVEVTPFEAVIDAGRVLDVLLRADYDLVLTGHKHQRRLTRFGVDTRSIDVFTGPSLFLANPGGSRPGFTVIDIQPAASPVYAQLRSYETADLREFAQDSLIRTRRTSPRVIEASAGLRLEQQNQYLLPVVTAVREAFQWRDSFEHAELHELFDRAWEQLREELSELSDRRLVMRPPLLLKPWEAFVRLAGKPTVDANSLQISLASENDLAYWDRAYNSPQSEAARYSKPLREFQGRKARILVLKDPAFDPDQDADSAADVIERMQNEGFHIEVVQESRLDRRTERDFGIIDNLAVFTFSGRRDEVRGLEIDFKPAAIARYLEHWHVLNDTACWTSEHPKTFLHWLQTEGPDH
jgi:3',5'-cyclic AMP phosphodiesterase CpdA